MLHVCRKDNLPILSTAIVYRVLISRTLVITASLHGRVPGIFMVFTGREVRYARAIDMSTKGDVAILELESPAPDHYPHLGISIESMAFGDYGLMVGHPREQYNEFGGWILSTIKANTQKKGGRPTGDTMVVVHRGPVGKPARRYCRSYQWRL